MATRKIKHYTAIAVIVIVLLVVFVINVLSEGEAEREINYNMVAYNTVEEEKPTEHIASWYDYALGETDQRCIKDREPCYSQVAETCASRDYPRGTRLKVSYNKNNLDTSVICRVNDYGPEEDFMTENGRRRDIDLS